MQKYRKWTDQATGINPFIIADQKNHNFFYNICTFIKSFLTQTILIILFPVIVLGSLIPLFSMLNSLLLAVGGNIVSYDDNKLVKDLSKMQKNKTRLILSNFVSFFDVFYFMYRISGPQFLVIHQNSTGQQSYQLTQGLGCLIKLFTKKQPFFVNHQDNLDENLQKSLKTLIQTNSNSYIVIFYEEIRTNGLGTIKLSKQFSQKLYQVQADYLICKIFYSPRDQLYFNMVRPPAYDFWRSLGSFTARNLKARSQITDISNIHTANELKKDVDQFMSTNGSKLLETSPRDFENFMEFFQKTQKSNYVHDSK